MLMSTTVRAAAIFFRTRPLDKSSRIAHHGYHSHPSTSKMVEQKKALKIKITMQGPKTPAKAREAQKRQPRLIVPALVGLALGVGSVLAWWGLTTGARIDEPEKETAPPDAQVRLEKPATGPSAASPASNQKIPSVAAQIDKAQSERKSPETEPRAEPLARAELPRTTPAPIHAVPPAEEIVASAKRQSPLSAETEPQQTAESPPPALPQPPSERLGAAPPPSISKPASTPRTSDSPHIARALFTSAIKGGQPTDAEGPLVFASGPGGRSLYFFTELRGLQGKTVVHRWEYQGQTMLNIPFKIGGNRWRVYSNKKLPSTMTGTWRVVVADSTGAVLGAEEFQYQRR